MSPHVLAVKKHSCQVPSILQQYPYVMAPSTVSHGPYPIMLICYVWYVWYPYVWYVICWNVRYHTLICLQGFFGFLSIVWCWYQVGEQSKDVTLMYGLFLVIINHEKCSWFIDEFVHFPNVRTNLWYLYVPSIDQQTKDLEFQPSKHHVVCINGFGVYVLLKETPFFLTPFEYQRHKLPPPKQVL